MFHALHGKCMIIATEMTLYLHLMVFERVVEMAFSPTITTHMADARKRENTLLCCYRQIAFATIKPLGK